MRAAFQRKGKRETRRGRERERWNCVFYVEYVCGIERSSEKDVGARRSMRERERERWSGSYTATGTVNDRDR